MLAPVSQHLAMSLIILEDKLLIFHIRYGDEKENGPAFLFYLMDLLFRT